MRIYRIISRFTATLLVAFVCISFLPGDKKTVLYLIGDSTVQNNDGNGRNEYWGWGTLTKPFFDSTRISVENHAKSGTSSRTFITEGRWAKVLEKLQPGDFLVIQFGHNDQAVINDSARAKGSLKGTGEETEDIFNLKTKQSETVHTYGWYMRKLIDEAKAKGATVIVCALVPRFKWKGDKVDKEIEYVNWAKEVAAAAGAHFFDLNNAISTQWERMGKDSVNTFFPIDHTHTNIAGANLNAAAFISGLQSLHDCKLANYLIHK